MKIGIDISQIVYEGSGVSRYVKNMIEAVIQYDTTNDYTFFFSSLRRNLPTDIENKITGRHRLVKLKLPPSVLDIFWNRFHSVSINRIIETNDFFISSDWTQPPVKKPTKSVTVAHDLVYLKYPETLHPKIVSVQKRRMKWVKKECDLIIADSDSTKADIVELLNIPENKIKVVYPSVSVQKPTESDLKQIFTKYDIRSTKYILSVGKLEPRKNIPALISAFQKANLKDTQLLIVGPKGWDSSIRHTKYDLPNTIKFLGFVPDTDLYALYSNALFFIYPSFYEGFGYPLVEAMSLGCPVATSNTSSMKEIAENCGLLFDPLSEEDMIEALETLHGNEKLRKQLSEKGKKRAGDFTLKKFANDLADTFA